MKNIILCDFKCPLHDKCAHYCEGFDKAKTLHWGVDPFDYKKNKCRGFQEIDIDDLVEKVNQILKPKMN